MESKAVLLRAYGDVALVRFAIDIYKKVVYIADTQGITDINNGIHPKRVVWFPIKAVYQYCEKSNIKYDDKVDWDKQINCTIC